MKRNTGKIIAAVSVIMLLSGSLSGLNAVLAEGQDNVIKTAAAENSDAVSKDNKTKTEDIQKEETVYVITDASGNPAETIVSSWLKNPDKKETIKDNALLSDIQNVKGDETFTEDGSGNITWQANGNDIYYQGRSENELPVSTQIKYTLNGEKKDPSELAGASGHLVIEISYINNISEEKEVNGKKVTLYEPFMVLSGVPFDNGKASGVTVSGGKVINTGDQTIAVGYTFPGLAESLVSNAVKEDESNILDIPEKFTVEADVTDFSLMTIITVIDNSLLNDLDLDNADFLDDLKNSANELTDASGKLVQGTDQLQSGTDELSSGAKTLTDGVDSLDEGAGTLSTGAKDLSNGADAIKEGALKLAEGAGILASGMEPLKDGALQLNGGLNELDNNVQGLPKGASDLYHGALKLNNALKNNDEKVVSLYDGADAIGQGAGQISAGLKSKDSENPGIYEAAQGIAQGADGIAQGADRISAASSGLNKEIGNMKESFNGLIAKYGDTIKMLDPDTYSELMGYASKIEQAEQALSAIDQGAQAISNGAKSNDPSNPGIYEAAGMIENGAGSLADGADSISEGSEGLKQGIDTIVDDKNLGAMINGLGELKGQSETLVGGIDRLAEGSKTLSDGVVSAGQGAKEIKNGSDMLNNYTGTLADGASRLSEGAASLKDGTSRLSDGGKTLTAGIDALSDGAKQLKEGMETFDKEGIQKLADYVNGDAADLIERLKAIKNMGNDYTTFSGREGVIPGKVQFIIRTESIE